MRSIMVACIASLAVAACSAHPPRARAKTHWVATTPENAAQIQTGGIRFTATTNDGRDLTPGQVELIGKRLDEYDRSCRQSLHTEGDFVGCMQGHINDALRAKEFGPNAVVTVQQVSTQLPVT